MTGRGTARATIVAIAVAGLAGLAGCYAPHPASGLPCSADRECPDGQRCDLTQPVPVCIDTAGVDAATGGPDGAPIGCDGPANCPVNAPVCDDTTKTCRGCEADAECSSGACLELDGVCVDEARTLYVTPNGPGGASCSRSAPCNLSTAVTMTSSTRDVIRVGDGTYPGGTYTFSLSTQVFVSGEDRSWNGAVLSPNATGIRIRGSANVVMEGLTIQDAGSDGINQMGGTLELERVKIHRTNQAGVDSSNGTLRMRQCWVEDAGANGLFINNDTLDVDATYLVRNNNGGVRATGSSVRVTSSVLAGNGTGGGDTSAASFTDARPGSLFAFNTVADNLAILEPGGVSCINSSVTVTSSIFANNGFPDVDDACDTTYSLFEFIYPPGNGNISGQAQFVDQTGSDYHITPASAARGAGAAAGAVTRDLDGEPRPQGTGYDIGADEIP